MIKIESLPEKILKAFYRTFEKISPVRVLIKIVNEAELPPGLPANVKIFRWLPQPNVLSNFIYDNFIKGARYIENMNNFLKIIFLVANIIAVSPCVKLEYYLL